MSGRESVGATETGGGPKPESPGLTRGFFAGAESCHLRSPDDVLLGCQGRYGVGLPFLIVRVKVLLSACRSSRNG